MNGIAFTLSRLYTLVAIMSLFLDALEDQPKTILNIMVGAKFTHLFFKN